MNEPKRPFAETHADTLRLIACLRKVKVGAALRYDELAAVAGRDLSKLYGILRTARKRIELEGYIFGPIPGIGLKRLSDIQTVEEGRRYVRQAGRKAGRARRTLGGVNEFETLPNDAKLRHNVAMAQAGIIEHQTRFHTAQRIAARVGEKALSPNDAVAMLRGIV